MRVFALILLTALLLLSTLLVPAGAATRSRADFQQLLAQYDRGDTSPETRAAIDRAAGQLGAWRSRLYWHTDLADALAEAKGTNKPILSLRLLGRLDEELSCANSRFFRKMLYVEPTISQQLQSRYVLHWESVRPVPLVIIDYGNGQKVTRTLTGNSIHYLLAPDGRVIDALPGLMDAQTFSREIGAFAMAVHRDRELSAKSLETYYAQTTQRLAALPAAPQPVRDADRAMNRTASKAIMERPVLAAVRNPSLYVKEDTLKNQRELRPQVIAWIRAGEGADLKKLNEKVYADLFITPLNDPLMGLALPDEAALFEGAPIVAPVAKR